MKIKETIVDIPLPINSQLFRVNSDDNTHFGHYPFFVCFYLDSARTTTAGSVATTKPSTSASTEPGKQIGEFTVSSGVRFF